MPEDMNLEVAHKLTEREDNTARESRRWEEVIEILGVLMLAVAAVATAWGGFQAAKRTNDAQLQVMLVRRSSESLAGTQKLLSSSSSRPVCWSASRGTAQLKSASSSGRGRSW